MKSDDEITITITYECMFCDEVFYGENELRMHYAETHAETHKD